MDNARARSAYRSRQSERIELGNEPPLSVDGGDAGFVDRRRVSVQWLSGTILTALCGAALMGGAVFTALGETNFALLPERVEVALRGALGVGSDRLGSPRKSDRLPTAAEPKVSREVIRVSTIVKVGNHDVVRVQPFVRVAGNLSLNASDLIADIPPYNPQRLLIETAPGTLADDDVPQAAPEAEVAFIMRDLPEILPNAKIAALTPRDEVIARVREAVDWSNKTAAHMPVAANISGIKLAYATDRNSDPYAGFEARIVPENVTLLSKTRPKATGGNPWDERVVLVRDGESVATVLKEFGATPKEIASITAALGAHGRTGGIRDGHRLRVLLAPAPGAKPSRTQPVRVIVATESKIEAAAALSDSGKYVAIQVDNVGGEIADAGDEGTDRNDSAGGVQLYQSVYETALRNNIPRAIADEIVRMYSYDVDFQRKVQPGDGFEVLYSGEVDAPAAGQGEILFAALTLGDEIRKLYRYQSPDDGIVDFYDDTGKSAKKFLVRKPVLDGIMRSGFGLRRHPILGYTKMHTGVDWAAPSGTPIYAAGNGTIVKVGWESGYGKYIRIRHTNGYETAYAHMTAYARNIEEGTRVRQGQVIGFVGSTGLSTGAHLHYEIIINDRFVNPMRIKLPRGRELTGKMLSGFERERVRIDNIMARKPARVARTSQLTRH